MPGENGGPAGDLFVTVKVSPHRLFGRKDDNLTIEVPISFDEAALGADVKIPTLGGAPVTLKIPAGTPNGRTFRVRGRGAKKKDGTNGDLLATVQVQVPARAQRAGPRGGRRLPRRHRGQHAPLQPVRAGHLVTPARTPEPDKAVYVISVAAELTGLHPQTLRAYERMGLIAPSAPGAVAAATPPATSTCCAPSPS